MSVRVTIMLYGRSAKNEMTKFYFLYIIILGCSASCLYSELAVTSHINKAAPVFD